MNNDPFSIKDKTVVVTGGTRGVGRAISVAFARAGASVFANYVRDQKAADEFLAAEKREGERLQIIRADLTNDADIKRLVAETTQNGTRISALIHCAATGVHKPVEQLTLRHFDWTFGLNVRAFLGLVTNFLPHFDPGSTILAISSEGAVRAATQYTLVGSSKGALEAMMRHFAAELAPKGIRVNAISPGTVLTDAWKTLPESERRLEEARKATPLQRLVTLEEVALTAQFLCSPAASGIIGQTLVVDGGARIKA
jgi:enoyl-[acyl-carrier protein] reductase III